MRYRLATLALTAVVFASCVHSAFAASYEVVAWNMANFPKARFLAFSALVFDNVAQNIYTCTIAAPSWAGPPAVPLEATCNKSPNHQSQIPSTQNINTVLQRNPIPSSFDTFKRWGIWQIDGVSGDLQFCYPNQQGNVTGDCIKVDFKNLAP